MSILRVRTGAVLTMLGLVAGCSGGGTPGTGGKSASAGGANGLAGANGAGGTQGAAGGNGGAGGAIATGGTAAGGAAGGSAGAAGSTVGVGGTTVGSAGGKGGSPLAGAGGSVVGAGGSLGGKGESNASGAGGTPSGAGGVGTRDKKVGIVIVSQSAIVLHPAPAGASVASGAQASFSVSAGTTDDCPTTTSGDCQAVECAPMANPTSSTATQYQAGDVSITGLLQSPLVLTYGINGLKSYMSTPTMSYLWTASRLATVTVTGSANVPAFTLGLTAPTPVTLTAPLGTPGTTGTTYTISKAGPLNVAWTGGVEGSVTVDLISGTTQTGRAQIQIHCSVDASKGMVTVPATFMTKLGASGFFTAGVTSIADKNVGDWLMYFQASTLMDSDSATFTN